MWMVDCLEVNTVTDTVWKWIIDFLLLARPSLTFHILTQTAFVGTLCLGPLLGIGLAVMLLVLSEVIIYNLTKPALE